MNCRVCNSTELVKILELKNAPGSAQLFLNSKEQDYHCSIDLQIKQCKKCGHVQTTNNPVDYYKEVITTAGLSKKNKWRKNINIKQDNFKKQFLKA